MRLNCKFIISTLIVGIVSFGLFSANPSSPILLDSIGDAVDKKQGKERKASRRVAEPVVEIDRPIVVNQSALTKVSVASHGADALSLPTAGVGDGASIINTRFKVVESGQLPEKSDGVAIMQEALGSAKAAIDSKPINVPGNRIGGKTHLGKTKADEIIILLEQDHEDNVKDLIKYRWCFRKCSNFTEAFGNSLLYLGSGLATIAGGVKLVGSEEVSNILLFISTVCFASHVTLIGMAKCSGREESERESQLEKLADAVGFKVTHLEPKIDDDSDQEKDQKESV